MTGDVTYLYAYDIAHEADLAAIETKLRGTAERFHLGRSKDAPRNFPSYRPLILQMDDVQIDGPLGPMTLSTSIKLFSVGAVSVNVRVPVSCEQITDLVALRDLTVKDNTTLEDRIGEIVRRLLETIKPQLIRRSRRSDSRRCTRFFGFDRPAGRRRCRQRRRTAIAGGVDRPPPAERSPRFSSAKPTPRA